MGRTKEAAEEAIRICRNRGVLLSYLAEREKEVIDIMVMLFDQEYAVRQYGIAQMNEGRQQGLEEGRILERIDMYRNEMGMDDEAIIAAIQKKFDLSESEARKYVWASVGA